MSERGIKLLETADGQISELTDLPSARGAMALSLPCSGREKLGDSTVAALALHTGDNYLRIAGSLKTASQIHRAHGGAGHDGHRIARLVRALGHVRPCRECTRRWHPRRRLCSGARRSREPARTIVSCARRS